MQNGPLRSNSTKLKKRLLKTEKTTVPKMIITIFDTAVFIFKINQPS